MRTKKVLSIIVSFMMILGMIPISDVSAAGTVELTGQTVINKDNVANYENRVITGGNRSIGASLSYSSSGYLVIDGCTVDLTFNGVGIEYNYSSGEYSRCNGIIIKNKGTLNLTIEGDNYVHGYLGGAGIYVENNSTLNITKESTGTLTAIGGDYYRSGSGIGTQGSRWSYSNDGTRTDTVACGRINIYGGHIIAQGGTEYMPGINKATYGSPGIGPGPIAPSAGRSQSGKIYIYGGVVEATGGYSAAAIGSGMGRGTNEISISGGQVTAISGSSGGAAIGDGYNGFSASGEVVNIGNISITGGTVKAVGNIGHGGAYNPDNIASGGTVTINNQANVTISNGRVIAGTINVPDNIPQGYNLNIGQLKADNKAIADADIEVVLNGTTVETGKTDNNGNASFRCLHAGQYVIHITKKGMKAVHQDITIKDRDISTGTITTQLVSDPVKPTVKNGTFTWNGKEKSMTSKITGFDDNTMTISGNTATDPGNYTMTISSQTNYWSDGTTTPITKNWKIIKTLSKPTDIKFNGNVLTWNAVEHATGYELQLYNDEEAVGDTITTTDTSYDFTSQITGNNHYKATVIALGDDDIYSDSSESTKVCLHQLGDTYSKDSTQHWRVCQDCKEKVGIENHSFGDWTITKQQTCVENGLKERTCSVCGYKETEEIGALAHDYQETWSSNETQHWHECSLCHDKKDQANHSFSDWKVTKKATCSQKGSKERTCSTCGYKETKEIDTLTHNYQEKWSSDETQHWHECSLCHDKKDQANHSFSDWKVTKKETCTTNGKEERTCSVCGYKETRERPATGHNYSSDWKNDETSHWHECSVCHDKKDQDDHTFGDWNTVKESTEKDTGLKERICEVCGYKETEDLPKLPHFHVGVLVPEKEATYIEKGNKAYYQCSCGQYFEDEACTKEIENPKDVEIPTLKYMMLDGKEQTYTKGTGKPLIFRANAPKDLCKGIRVDGKDVNENNYTLTSGSTIVTLHNDYLDTLSIGQHTLTVVYPNGETSTTFTINGEQKTSVSSNNTKTSTKSSVNTSDDININRYLITILIAGCVCIGLLYKKRKTYK